jgi:hypothetical protein
LRPLLPLLVVASLVSIVVIFPAGYQDKYNTMENVAPFNLSSDSSNLQTAENQNLDSGQWSRSGPTLSMGATGVANLQIWAFLTARAVVYFPPLVGTQLVFSGTSSGLNLASSAIRVSLVLTYLSRVVTLYYLVGDPSIPPNTGSYSNFGVNIPSNGTAFSARRDVVQDLSNAGAGVDVGWEIRSISFGFVVYPSSSNVQVPIRVTFSSNQTSLLLQGTRITASYSSAYNGLYYLAPLLVLVAMVLLYTSGPIRRRTVRSGINRRNDRTG